MPTLNSHTHCQAAQANRTSQSLSKSVSFPYPSTLYNKIVQKHPVSCFFHLDENRIIYREQLKMNK